MWWCVVVESRFKLQWEGLGVSIPSIYVNARCRSLSPWIVTMKHDKTYCPGFYIVTGSQASYNVSGNQRKRSPRFPIFPCSLHHIEFSRIHLYSSTLPRIPVNIMQSMARVLISSAGKAGGVSGWAIEVRTHLPFQRRVYMPLSRLPLCKHTMQRFKHTMQRFKGTNHCYSSRQRYLSPRCGSLRHRVIPLRILHLLSYCCTCACKQHMTCPGKSCERHCICSGKYKISKQS